MEFLRAHSLIHRDIKPQNLLLSPPTADSPVMTIADTKIRIQLTILKIADFGFARLLPSQSLASTLCGSPLYMVISTYLFLTSLFLLGARDTTRR